MGVVGALALAGSYGTLTWKLLYQGMASRAYGDGRLHPDRRACSASCSRGSAGRSGSEHLLSLPGGRSGFLIFVNAFIFVAAFFLDFFQCLHHHPASRAGGGQARDRNLVWFGVLICATYKRASCTRLSASRCLFAGHSSPSVRDVGYLLGAIPGWHLQVILVVIVIFWPGSVTTGPTRALGSIRRRSKSRSQCRRCRRLSNHLH